MLSFIMPNYPVKVMTSFPVSGLYCLMLEISRTMHFYDSLGMETRDVIYFPPHPGTPGHFQRKTDRKLNKSTQYGHTISLYFKNKREYQCVTVIPNSNQRDLKAEFFSR